MNQGSPAALLQLRGGQCEEIAIGAVHKANGADGIGDPDHQGGAVGHNPKPPFTFFQGLLGPAAQDGHRDVVSHGSY